MSRYGHLESELELGPPADYADVERLRQELGTQIPEAYPRRSFRQRRV